MSLAALEVINFPFLAIDSLKRARKIARLRVCENTFVIFHIKQNANKKFIALKILGKLNFIQLKTIFYQLPPVFFAS